MKKAFFALIFLSALQASAQFNSKFVFVGVRGEANFSKLQTSEFKISKPGASIQDFFQNNSTNRTGYVLGAYARIGRKFFIQPEVLLSSKGGTFEIFKNGSATPVNVDVKFSQIDIPVLVGFKLGPLRVNAVQWRHSMYRKEAS